MKKIIVGCLVFLTTLTVAAQKDFEGMIRYKLTSPEGLDEEREESFEMKIFFTPGKILMQSQKEGDDDEDILVLFDSAKIYMLKRPDKTYRAKKLWVLTPSTPAQKETIAGYKTTPLLSTNNNWAQMMGRRSVLWFADDLVFHVPSQFEGNEYLMMVHNNRILLKAKIMISDRYYYGGDDEEEERGVSPDKYEIEMVALEVVPGPQPASLFTIPNDYTKETYPAYPSTDSVTVMMDTPMVMVDTAMAAPLEQPPPPKKTPAKTPPAKTKTTTKSPAKKED